MILKQDDLKSYASTNKTILYSFEKKLGKMSPETTKSTKSTKMRLFKKNIKDVYYKR